MAIENPRFPHTCTITRKGASSDPMEDEGVDKVIYEGECRGSDKDTTSMNGEVITTNRLLSLPKSLKEWTEDDIPQEGDKLVINYGPYTETGEIIDRRPANFHGSHFIWRHVKS